MRVQLDIIVEAFCLMLLAAVTIYVGYFWFTLPDTIPIHFNAAGQIDGYGSKSIILIMLPVMFIFYCLLTLVQKFPDLNNYIVTITQENQERQYRMVKTFIRILKLEFLLNFAYLQHGMIRAAVSGLGLGVWFLPIILSAIFSTIGIYLYKSLKAK